MGWDKFMLKHVQQGWEAKLHFDHILSNFGFTTEETNDIREKKFTKPDGEEVTFEQHAFRWLSKAFSAYGPPGALTDVVNVIFAMTDEKDTSKLTDIEIAKKISEFGK